MEFSRRSPLRAAKELESSAIGLDAAATRWTGRGPAALLKRGDISANVDVKPGDIIIVPQSWF